jgi:hypothetical protein
MISRNDYKPSYVLLLQKDKDLLVLLFNPFGFIYWYAVADRPPHSPRSGFARPQDYAYQPLLG